MNTKIIELEAFDGSIWHVPLTLVVESYRRDCNCIDAPSDAHLIDWARNDMNWADVKGQAVCVKLMDPPDMEDAWANGKMRLVEPQESGGAQPTHFGGVVLTQEQVDALALSLKVSEALTSKAILDIYYDMRNDAATILAGVQPGDHGDAILAAFGERVARIGIMRAAGLPA